MDASVARKFRTGTVSRDDYIYYLNFRMAEEGGKNTEKGHPFWLILEGLKPKTTPQSQPGKGAAPQSQSDTDFTQSDKDFAQRAMFDAGVIGADKYRSYLVGQRDRYGVYTREYADYQSKIETFDSARADKAQKEKDATRDREFAEKQMAFNAGRLDYDTYRNWLISHGQRYKSEITRIERVEQKRKDDNAAAEQQAIDDQAAADKKAEEDKKKAADERAAALKKQRTREDRQFETGEISRSDYMGILEDRLDAEGGRYTDTGFRIYQTLDRLRGTQAREALSAARSDYRSCLLYTSPSPRDS